ncbi:uncharacterized protein M6B38_117040 [Iris pallida]|uniref:Uncharacterized protein n=1 Tax=Iris pallida TaxID=29817 RepID=A0AAX6HRV0_IRIPA|nr:uncharacterized protein M6B38_117040 [Iris pallida]
MEGLKKAKVYGSRRSNSDEDSSGGGSEGEEGYIFRAPLDTNDHSSRKRVKLQGKASASDDHRPVDLAMVPRRLRSTINKRLCQLVSPPLSDSKRKQLHSLNGTQLSNGYIAERFRQNMFDQVTEDEEEVAQALTMLIIPVTISKLIKNKEDRRTLEEKSVTKEVSASFSEALEETTTVLLPCNISIGHNPCGEESHRDVLKPETSAMGKQIAVSLSQNFDAGRNQTTQSDSCRTPLSNNGKEGDVASPGNAIYSSIPLGTSLQNLAEPGGLQQTQLGASSMHRCDIGLWPVGSNLMGNNLQSVEKKFYSGTAHHISQREATPDTLHGFSSSVHGHLTIPSSSKATGCQRSLTASASCSSAINDSPTERLSSIDGKAPYKKCATHVFISHLIRNYKNREKGQHYMLPVDQSKAEEGTNYAEQTANGMGLRSGKSPTISNGFHMEKSSLRGNTQTLHDGGLLQAQVISSGAYGQKKQGGESSASAVVTMNSGNGSKSSEQFHVPYLPHHSLMPFPFPRGPYSSHYQDQLAAAASRQVQLQLPYFVGSSASYGPQMVHTAGGTTMKQQQMMWQAQVAYLRPPSGFPVKWQQNGQHSNSVSSSSPSLRTQSPPSIFPSPKDHHPVNNRQHFLLPVPPSTPSLPPSRAKQQHQQNGVTLNLEASTQLQVLCNAETYI